MHSFEFGPAAEAFRESQQADPNFALAYWGEAMTHNHPLWRHKDRDAALEVLNRLAPSAAERRAKAGTQREALYLDAVETLFAEGSKGETDRAYMELMRELQEEHPDDMEARSFYALSILGSVDGSRDFATYMRAAAVAQPVFDANPQHPGAAHYLIHSFDDPVHAPLGLKAAQSYADIAPDAAHAQHMTTHIFVALGLWNDVVKGNIRATNTQDKDLAERDRPPNLCGHYSSWLHYGHLMLGNLEQAESMMDACFGRVSEQPNEGEWYSFVAMRARHIVDTEDWSLRSRWTATPPDTALDPGSDDSVRPGFAYQLTNVFAALRDGDEGPAKQFLTSIGKPTSEAERLQTEQLAGLVSIHDGEVDKGIESLRAAAEAEDKMPYAFGPPAMVKPTFELLGFELARAGRKQEAKVAYRRAAARTPGRPLATVIVPNDS